MEFKRLSIRYDCEGDARSYVEPDSLTLQHPDGYGPSSRSQVNGTPSADLTNSVPNILVVARLRHLRSEARYWTQA